MDGQIVDWIDKQQIDLSGQGIFSSIYRLVDLEYIYRAYYSGQIDI